MTLYPDINDLFLAADALVTDYSSVMFDFALLDRPILLLTPDIDTYRDTLRGFYFDIESAPPGAIYRDVERLVEDVVAARPDDGAGARAAFRERFAPWDDGHATTRVVDVAFDGG